MEIRAKLRMLREGHGISQARLGRAFGTTRQNIHRIENSPCNPRLETLIKYADFFGITLDEIVGRWPPKKKA